MTSDSFSVTQCREVTVYSGAVTMRRAIPVAAGIGAVLMLTGCTPPFDGDIGLGLDSDGDVIASVQMCRRSADSVIAFFEPDSGSTDEERLAEWRFDDPVSDFGTVDLGDAGSLKALIESHQVYVQAVAENSGLQMPVIKLTSDLIDSLEVGVVSDADSTTTIDEFRAEAC